jgi:hypothetical protein
VREALESKVNEIMDALGADPQFNNDTLATVADHLNALVDCACDQPIVPVDLNLASVEAIGEALQQTLDPVLEMSLRVSTMLDAMQRQASKS